MAARIVRHKRCGEPITITVHNITHEMYLCCPTCDDYGVESIDLDVPVREDIYFYYLIESDGKGKPPEEGGN